jgi:hypothetical protein
MASCNDLGTLGLDDLSRGDDGVLTIKCFDNKSSEYIKFWQ